jgi:PAS domain S-box-containing protein
MLGRTIAENFPEAVGTPFDQLYRSVMETQRAGSVEAFYSPLSIWLEARAFPSPGALTIFVRDITARRRAEQALRNSEERFRKIFENATLGIGYAGVEDHRIQLANDAFCRMLGYTREELTAIPIEKITHPDDLALTQENIHRLMTGEIPSYIQQKRYFKKNGEILHAKLYVSPIRDKNDRIIVHFALIEDITQRLHAQEAMRLNNERLALAQRIGHFGVFEWNLQTRHVIASPELEEIYGIPRGTLTADVFWDQLAHPEDRDAVRKQVEGMIVRRESGHIQVRIVRADGVTRWIEVTWNTLVDAKERPERAVGVVMDITDRKFAAQALHEQQERLALAQEAAGMGVFEIDLATDKAVASYDI